MSDIRKSSKSPDTTIMKQGHTSNGSFGSEPNVKVKGRAVRDLSNPVAKR